MHSRAIGEKIGYMWMYSWRYSYRFAATTHTTALLISRSVRLFKEVRQAHLVSRRLRLLTAGRSIAAAPIRLSPLFTHIDEHGRHGQRSKHSIRYSLKNPYRCGYFIIAS
jgi:hypothetical protein